MVEIDPERFEVMVSKALDALPEELGKLMSNVAVTVQHDAGPPGLLGLYQGIPLTRRTTSYAGALPDRITIFRRAICAARGSEPEIVEQVRRTVLHEVGHHFGIADTRLREPGWVNEEPIRESRRVRGRRPASAAAAISSLNRAGVVGSRPHDRT